MQNDIKAKTYYRIWVKNRTKYIINNNNNNTTLL